MNRRLRNILAVMLIALMGSYGLMQHYASAGPGNKGTMYSVAMVDANEHVIHRTLIAAGVHTMPNTTPVVTDKVCLEGDPDTFAARLTLTGTMAGTNPVVTNVLQSSDDGGTTWTAVGSAFAAINSTVTPSAGKERITFADTEAGGVNTPVIYGECFRVQTTWAGTGTVTANFGISLYAE